MIFRGVFFFSAILCLAGMLSAQSLWALEQSRTQANLSPTEATGVNSLSLFGSRSIGHNLSNSGVTLKKGQTSVGTFYAGVGLSDTWTIGISPFVWNTYRMQHYGTRFAHDLNTQQRLLFAVDYFKTFGEESTSDRLWRRFCSENVYTRDCARGRYPWGFTSFKMEALSFKITDSMQINPNYRMNLTASYYFYFDDEKPFSLRMDPQNSDPFAINFTSLHEFKISKNFFWNLEGGFWGLNYQYPYVHVGSTLNLQLKNMLLGGGVSSTFSPSFPAAKARRFAGYDSRASYHPEIQLQAFF